MEYLMKVSLILISFFSAISFNSFATDDMLAKEKANIEQNIDKRISMLQDEKSCVSAVTNKEDFKKCREKAEAAYKALEAEHKAKRAEHIDQQIKKLQEEKEKMNTESKK